MIRPATLDDAPGIEAISTPTIQHTAITFNARVRSIDEIAEMIADRPFFVAEEAGEVIGFASYTQFRGGVGYRFTVEHTIMLAEDARGRGAGRALMTALMDHARLAGMHSIWAGISAENPDGVSFHERIGFEHVARLPEVGFKFGRWMDLVLMRKAL